MNRYKYDNYYKKYTPDYYKLKTKEYGDKWQDCYLEHYTADKTGEWVEIPFTWYSDYSGCLVERSNYNCILEDYNKYVMADFMRAVYGGYGTSGLIVRSILLDTDNTLIDLFNGLNEYPLYNEDDYYQMEFEAIQEALNDYGYDDIYKILGTDTVVAGKLNDIIFNGNYTIETGGLVWIDAERVAALYAAETVVA